MVRDSRTGWHRTQSMGQMAIGQDAPYGSRNHQAKENVEDDCPKIVWLWFRHGPNMLILDLHDLRISVKRLFNGANCRANVPIGFAAPYHARYCGALSAAPQKISELFRSPPRQNGSQIPLPRPTSLKNSANNPPPTELNLPPRAVRTQAMRLKASRDQTGLRPLLAPVVLIAHSLRAFPRTSPHGLATAGRFSLARKPTVRFWRGGIYRDARRIIDYRRSVQPRADYALTTSRVLHYAGSVLGLTNFMNGDWFVQATERSRMPAGSALCAPHQFAVID